MKKQKPKQLSVISLIEDLSFQVNDQISDILTHWDLFILMFTSLEILDED